MPQEFTEYAARIYRICRKKLSNMPYISYVDKIINGNFEDKNLPNAKIELILKSLARNESSTASISRISKDIQEVDEKSISPDTVASYIIIRTIMVKK